MIPDRRAGYSHNASRQIWLSHLHCLIRSLLLCNHTTQKEEIIIRTVSLLLNPHNIDVYIPDENPSAIVYLHASSEDGNAVWQQLPEPRPALAVISGTDWNRDFSPWPAEKVFPTGEPFAGGAETYFHILNSHIIPAVEDLFTCPPSVRCVSGYSLAGLFAVWCVFKYDTFDCAAALSSSLWYDGFTEFVLNTVPSKRLRRISLSLGDREKRTRNNRMTCIEEALHTVLNRLKACGIQAEFRYETGGHFDDVTGRIARGIALLYMPDGM